MGWKQGLSLITVNCSFFLLPVKWSFSMCADVFSLWGFRFIDKDLVASYYTLIYLLPKMWFWVLWGANWKVFCKVIYIPKEHPATDRSSPCVRRQLAEIKRHTSGNGGCICGNRLCSRKEDEAEVLRNVDPERWCPLCWRGGGGRTA